MKSIFNINICNNKNNNKNTKIEEYEIIMYVCVYKWAYKNSFLYSKSLWRTKEVSLYKTREYILNEWKAKQIDGIGMMSLKDSKKRKEINDLASWLTIWLFPELVGFAADWKNLTIIVGVCYNTCKQAYCISTNISNKHLQIFLCTNIFIVHMYVQKYSKYRYKHTSIK